MPNSQDEVLIVGSGPMAQAYAAVLRGLKRRHRAVCRSETSAEIFRAATGSQCRAGGLEHLLAIDGPPKAAIAAVSVADLAPCTERLIEAGCRSILVEKPGGIVPEDVARVSSLAERHGAEVHVAYNRRFYSSVQKAVEMVAEDGGVTSFAFEFTEVADRIAQLPYPREVLAHWELANSTHVIDTAFFIAGTPRRIDGVVGGSLPWHPRAARFFGHGETETGAMFSYSADWDAPGRWGIDINTRQRRLVLRPMEKLQVQKRGSFALEECALDDALDRNYKPGLYLQTRAWLTAKRHGSLLDIGSQAEKLAFVATHMMGMTSPRAN